MSIPRLTKATFAHAIALLIIVLSFNLLHASEKLEFLPGLWTFTGSLDPDLGGKGAQTYTECVTEDLMDTDRMADDMERGFGDGSCAITPTLDGKVLTLNLACASNVGTANGLGLYTISDDGKSMEGSMDVTMAYSGQSITVKMSVNGKHTDDSC